MGEIMYHHYVFVKEVSNTSSDRKIYHIYFVFLALVCFTQANGICCVTFPVYFGIDFHWTEELIQTILYLITVPNPKGQELLSLFSV